MHIFFHEEKKQHANEMWWNIALYVLALDEKNSRPVTLFRNYGCGYFRLEKKKDVLSHHL